MRRANSASPSRSVAAVYPLMSTNPTAPRVIRRCIRSKLSDRSKCSRASSKWCRERASRRLAHRPRPPGRALAQYRAVSSSPPLVASDPEGDRLRPMAFWASPIRDRPAATERASSRARSSPMTATAPTATSNASASSSEATPSSLSHRARPKARQTGPQRRLVPARALRDLGEGQRPRARAEEPVPGQAEEAPAAVGGDHLLDPTALLEEELDQLAPIRVLDPGRGQQAGLHERCPVAPLRHGPSQPRPVLGGLDTTGGRCEPAPRRGDVHRRRDPRRASGRRGPGSRRPGTGGTR